MLLETASPDTSLVVSAHDMHEEAVLAWWMLGLVELPTPCAEKMVAGCVDVHWCRGFCVQFAAFEC